MVRRSILQHGFCEYIPCGLYLRRGQDHILFFPAHSLCLPEEKDVLIIHGIVSESASAEWREGRIGIAVL
jgi:hypothetical protein